MLRPDQIASANPSPAVWVVAGEEPLLVEESADAIRVRLRAAGFDERVVQHVDRGFDWSTFAAECATGSLFAEQRLFELRFAVPLGAAAASELRDTAAKAGDSTALLAIAGPLDSRARKTKWFRELDEAAALVYAWRVRPEQFPGWIRQRLQREQINAQPGVAEAIAACSEGHLLAAAQLIRQLGALHADGNASLTAADVQTVGADMAQFDPFMLMDAVFAGDSAAALRAARGLRRGSAELPAVTGGLAFVLRQWAAAQQSFVRSGDAGAAARAAGIFGPRAQSLALALRRAGPGMVQGLQRWLADIDHQAKRGQAQAAWDDLLTWTAVASGAVRPDFLPRSCRNWP